MLNACIMNDSYCKESQHRLVSPTENSELCVFSLAGNSSICQFEPGSEISLSLTIFTSYDT